MSFSAGFGEIGSGFGTLGSAAAGKVKANPISTVIIVILLILVVTVAILLFLEISNGLFRKKLPGESCKDDDNCGDGLVCSIDEECALP